MTDKNNEVELLMAQIAEMKKEIQSLKRTKKSANSSDDTNVVIGCRMLCGVTLESRDESVVLNIPWREEIEFYDSDFRSVLTNPFGYRNLFRDDILYFVNKSDYAKYRIKKELSLDDASILHAITEPDVLGWLNKITNNRSKTNVMFCVLFTVAALYKEGKLDNWKYEQRKQFQTFFGVELDSYAQTLVDTHLQYE